jgi:hypothetical protein
MPSRNPDFGGKVKKEKKGVRPKTDGRAAPGERMAAAWKAWIESEEGKDCARFSTLGAASHPEPYLHNRLWRAFMAGAKRPAKPAPSLSTDNDRFVKRTRKNG